MYQILSVLARKFGVMCLNLVSVPGQDFNKQAIMDLTSKIQGPEAAIKAQLHAKVNSGPKDFPF